MGVWGGGLVWGVGGGGGFGGLGVGGRGGGGGLTLGHPVGDEMWLAVGLSKKSLDSGRRLLDLTSLIKPDWPSSHTVGATVVSVAPRYTCRKFPVYSSRFC